MQKLHKVGKTASRLTAALLGAGMCLSMLGSALVLPASAAPTVGVGRSGGAGPTAGVTDRQADPSTMDTYREMLALDTNTRYAGRLWSDKTVFAYGQNETQSFDDGATRSFEGNKLTLTPALDGVSAEKTIELNDDFLHVYSVLGSSQEINEHVPVDLILGLDITASMLTSGAIGAGNPEHPVDGDSNLSKTFKAANQLISDIRSYSDDSRISIVVHWGTAFQLVPFVDGTVQFDSYYTQTDGGNHNAPIITYTITWDNGDTSTYEYDPRGGTNTYKSGVEKSDIIKTGGAGDLGGGTSTEAGVYTTLKGLADLGKSGSLKYRLSDGSYVNRVPAAVILGDGYANHTLVKAGDGDSSMTYGTSSNPSISGDWWKVYGAKAGGDEERQKSAGSVDSDISKPTAAVIGGVLQGAYWKAAVANAYGLENVADVPVFTVGIGDSSNAYPVLNPAHFFTPDNSVYGDFVKKVNGWKDKTDLTPYTFSGETASTAYANNDTPSINRQNTTYNYNIPSTSDDYYGFYKVEPSQLDLVYTNQYFPVTSDTSMDEVFRQIYSAITQRMFTPVGGSNDLGVDDSVTYRDPIGKYMEVKDVKNLLFLGELYNIVPSGIYDYQFNDTLIVDRGGSSGAAAFEEGWYYGDDPKDPRNQNGPLPSVKDKGDNSYPRGIEGVNSPADAWAAGYRYYYNFKTAQMQCPTLPLTDTPGEMPEAQRQTVYTFYRLDMPTNDRRELKMNPVYSVDPDTDANTRAQAQAADDAALREGDQTNSAHLAYPGVYALSDVRIWVEDSGDYNASGVVPEADTNNDEALYINLPVNMLPLRAVTLEQGDTQGSWTYTSNLTADVKNENAELYAAGFPLRVFYTVGVAEDVLTSEGTVDIAANLSNEYIKDNKLSSANRLTVRGYDDEHLDDIEFFSNWYNPENRYTQYVTTTDEYSYGDAAISFSPSEDNRYYIFEKPLPLYSKAYVWVPNSKNMEDPAAGDGTDDGNWKLVQIANDDDDLDDVHHFTATDFGGKIIALDLEPEYPSTIDPTEARVSNQQNMWTALNAAGVHQVHAGDIILLKNHRLSNVDKAEPDDPFPSDAYFYLPIEYYELDPDGTTATKVTYAITRKGSEFGSAYTNSGISNGQMLCWYDTTGNHQDTVWPYNSATDTGDLTRGRNFIGAPLDENGKYKADTGVTLDQVTGIPDTNSKTTYGSTWGNAWNNGEWVVAARPGGLRVGMLAQAIGSKTSGLNGGKILQGDEYDEYSKERFGTQEGLDEPKVSVVYYRGNTTRTANNYYMPTISSKAVEGEVANVSVNTYLGNNGRLTVPDTTLLLTKLVRDSTGALNDVDGRQFKFQVFLDSEIPEQTAIVVRYNAALGRWQRQLHYVDMELGAKNLLQYSDGTLVLVDENGTRVTGSEGSYTYAEGAHVGEVYNPSGKGPYYVFVPSNSDTLGDTIAATSLRVYHNPAVDKPTEGSGEISTNDVVMRYTGDDGETVGTPPPDYTGKVDFYAVKVYLVGVQTYTDKDWEGTEPDTLFDTSGTAAVPKREYYDEQLTNKDGAIYLCSFEGDTSGSEIDVNINTPYLTQSTYWTNTYYLGYKYGIQDWAKENAGADISTAPENLKLTENDLYDPTEPSKDRANFAKDDGTPYDREYLARHTLEAQRPHGYGLLFSGLASGTNYRFTEQLTDEDIDAGFLLNEVQHSQQFGSLNTYRIGRNQFTDLGTGNAGTSFGVLDTPEGFGHSNALLWESYATFAEDDAMANHHAPERDALNRVGKNPACEEGAADETQTDGSVRHYFVRNGELVDKHYEDEQSLFGANRYVVGPTAHFYNRGHAYSVFGNTGTYEESANYVNTWSTDKTETLINDTDVSGETGDLKPGVQAGDTITYQITWRNTATDEAGTAVPANVTVVDPLDKGVAFVSASDGGVYDAATHTVTWDFGTVEASTTGTVTLTVSVTEDAEEYWDYDMDGDPDAPVDENDYLVRNRATVRVADNEYYTDVVRNPVGKPHKTETAIDPAATPAADPAPAGDLTYAGGKYHGPLVMVGDKITYEMEWRNYQNKAATVTVRDPLDKNVKFISASWKPDDGTDSAGAKLTTPEAQSIDSTGWTVPNKPQDVASDKKAGGYGKDGSEQRTVITYTADGEGVENGHTVTWNLGTQPAGASGKVVLTVEVLDTATPAGQVDNTAYVTVGNDAEQHTETIENPTPQQQKEETAPGEGVLIGVGESISYTIHWENYQQEAARVIVMDTLDPGVDFVEASEGYQYYPEAGQSIPALEPGGAAIPIPAHTVVWLLENQEPNAEGDVTLTVKVNENAEKDYSYNAAGDALVPDRDTHTDGKDYMVYNQARVKVGNDPFLKTQIPQNPVPEKDETAVDHADDTLDTGAPIVLTPKEGADNTWTGPLVYVGDVLTYHIHYTNGHDEKANVIVTDTLDEGVTLVEATPADYQYNEKTRTVTWTLPDVEPGKEGYVELKVKVNELATEAGFVANTAQVKVGTDPAVVTETIENPTPKVEKIEIDPGEDLQVMPGDQIDYEITWKNYDIEHPTADVIIRDKLDPGVDFASAAYLDGVLANSASAKKPEKANLTISLRSNDASAAAPAEEQTFTLTLDGELDPAGYTWVKDDADATSGTWKPEDNTITLKPGESVTVKDLPVGVLYTVKQGADEILAGKVLGLYGSTVTVKVAAEVISLPGVPLDSVPAPEETGDEPEETGITVTKAQVFGAAPAETQTDTLAPDAGDEAQPDTPDAAEPGEDTPEPTDTPAEPTEQPAAPTEAAPDTGTDEPAAEPTEAPADPTEQPAEPGDVPATEPTAEPTTEPTAEPTTEPATEPTDEPVIVYTFSAVAYDLPAPTYLAPEPSSDPVQEYKVQDAYGDVFIRYYAEEHMVEWVLKGRPANAEGVVKLSVIVNPDAEKFWDYQHPEWGPADNQKDDRVRNRAGVKVGDYPEVETRVLENPTKPSKIETEVNDTNVRRDLVADENGYIGPDVNVLDTITYHITWQNNAVDALGQMAKAEIVITDPLDEGVDFVSAEPQEFAAYDAASHTVTWNLGERDVRERGVVTLVVQVNDKALKPGETQGEVENQATVSVGNNPQQTDKVRNPVNDLAALVVRKTVTGDLGDKQKEFNFTVTLSDSSITGDYGEMHFDAGIATFVLKDGESRSASRLPANTGYRVVEAEANADGYSTTVEGDVGVIPAGGIAEANFVNRKVSKPDPHKTEVTPGDGKLVLVGDTLSYNITWQNREAVEADVTIRDPLDKGVDFVSADNGGVYDAATHTVTWQFKAAPDTEGTVALQVRVNENARPAGMVQNQAFVQVGNEPEIETEIPKNPVPDPHKIETAPGDKQPVGVGDRITYQISWQNPEDAVAKVTIRDPLDQGVDFVSANFDGVYDRATHTVTWTFDAQPHTDGYVTLTVKVNRKALQPEIVHNQAFVKIGDHPEVATEIPENPIKEPPPPTIPQTGDTSNPYLWAVLLAVSLAGLVLVGVFYRKHKRRTNGKDPS